MKRWLYDLSLSNIFKLVYCILATLYVIITVIIYNTYRTYDYKGQKFRVISASETEVVSEDRNGNRLVLTANTSDLVKYFEQDYTISYLDEIILYKSSIKEDRRTFTYSDGSQTTEKGISRFFINNKERLDVRLSESQLAERELIYTLNDYCLEFKELGLYILVDFSGLLLLLCGVGSFLYPEKFWRFEHFLDVIGGEPTDFAIFMNKLGGIVLIIFSYSIIFIFL